jgi:hypothetical protein
LFQKLCRLWDDMEKCGRAIPATGDNIIQQTHFVYWITKAIDTHSEYIIPLAIARQQWLCKCASILCLYVHYLSCWNFIMLCANLWCLRFSQRYGWKFRSSRVWHCDVGWAVSNTLKDHNPLIFRVKQSCHLLTRQRRVRSQKACVLHNTSVEPHILHVGIYLRNFYMVLTSQKTLMLM